MTPVRRRFLCEVIGINASRKVLSFNVNSNNNAVTSVTNNSPDKKVKKNQHAQHCVTVTVSSVTVSVI